jgi:hypothetical protein
LVRRKRHERSADAPPLTLEIRVNPSNPRAPRSILHYAPLALLALAVLLYAAYFSHLTLLRYHAFEARALDLGNLNQAIWNTAHGDWFRLTNQERRPHQPPRLSRRADPAADCAALSPLPGAGISARTPGRCRGAWCDPALCPGAPPWIK